MKHWGRKKIEHGLKERFVSTYCIKKALAQIVDTDYENALHRLANNKWEALKGTSNVFTKMKKLQDYLLQKGYEYELVNNAVKKIREEKR